MSERIPAVCKAIKVCFQMINNFVPQLCHQHQRYQDGPKEGTDDCGVATAMKLPQCPGVSGFCELLLEVHTKVFSHCGAIDRSLEG